MHNIRGSTIKNAEEVGFVFSESHPLSPKRVLVCLTMGSTYGFHVAGGCSCFQLTIGSVPSSGRGKGCLSVEFVSASNPAVSLVLVVLLSIGELLHDPESTLSGRLGIQPWSFVGGLPSTGVESLLQGRHNGFTLASGFPHKSRFPFVRELVAKASGLSAELERVS